MQTPSKLFSANSSLSRANALNLASLCLGLMIPFALCGTTRLWSADGPVLAGGALMPIVILLGLALICFYKGRNKPLVQPMVYAAVWGIFFSDWMCRDYSFLPGPSIRGELLMVGAILFILPTQKLWRSQNLIKIVISLISLAALCLLIHTKGAPITSDDHSTFLFRLELLKNNFPKIPFWHPLWNIGWDARDFFATGSLNFFFLFAPLLYTFNIPSIYTTLVTVLLFAIVPLCMLLAARTQGFSFRTSLLASMLSVTTSLIWYRWALKYGTLGFVTSNALMPLVFAYAIKILSGKILSGKQPLKSWEVIFFAALSTLMLFWSPAGLVFVPLLGFALFHTQTLLSNRQLQILVLLLIILNLPWISLFWKFSKVSSFLDASKPGIHASSRNTPSSTTITPQKYRHAAEPVSFTNSIKNLRKDTFAANPLLIIGAVCSVLLIKRSQRLFYLLTFSWLALLGSAGVALKPQLELDRMLIILLHLACIPTARLLLLQCRALSQQRSAKIIKFSAALTLSLLLCGILPLTQILLNRSLVQFPVEDQAWVQMRDLIKRYTGKGRLLFSGSIVHHFNDSHLAPLSIQTGTSLIASSPVHNLWWHTDIIPEEIRIAREQRIEPYFDHMNVIGVFAHEAVWDKYFRSQINYKRIVKIKDFAFYERTPHRPGYFEAGSGTLLDENVNSITLKLKTPNAILRYRYFDFLAAHPCKLSPANFEDLPLIKLENCPTNVPITIESITPWQRFMNSNSQASSDLKNG